MESIFFRFYFWILAIFSQQLDHATDCMERALIFRIYNLISNHQYWVEKNVTKIYYLAVSPTALKPKLTTTIYQGRWMMT